MTNVRNDSYFFGAADAKVFEITADGTSAYTVGSAIDIPGIKNFSSSPNLKETKLTGDGVTLATHTKIEDGTFSFECAKTDFSLLQTLWGGRYCASSIKNTFSLQKGDVPNYFQLAVRPEGQDVGIGSSALHLMKCKISSATSDGSEDAFNTVKVSGTMFFTDKTFTRKESDGVTDNIAGLMYDQILYAADTALSAITT